MHCSPRHRPEGGDAVAAGVVERADLALDAADPEPAGHEHAVHPGEGGRRPGRGPALVGGHPPHLDLGAVREPAGADRLAHREVRVGQVHVLPDDGDGHRLAGLVHPLEQVAPHRPVDVAERQPEAAHHVRVEALGVQDLGDVVDRRGVGAGDDAVLLDVAHQGDLAGHLLRDVPVGAQHEPVGLDTDVAQRRDGVLGRLGLQLARRREERHQRHVQEEAVVAADLVAQLAGGLEEGQRLDVADGAADLGDHDVGRGTLVPVAHREHPRLDLVGDVRDDLHGVAEVLTAALLGDHLGVHLAGGDVGPRVEVAVQEALVVTDVEVGLGAVLGHEDLAVLERVHRAGVDVEVGVELLHRHPQAPAGEQLPEARGGQALAQRGRDAAGHEDVLRGARVLHGHIPPRRRGSVRE